MKTNHHSKSPPVSEPLLTHAQLKIATLALSELKPHPKNPRSHPEPGSREWNALKKSLANVYFDPLVWNKRNGMLVSGHLRRKVLEEMGCLKADVVVIDVDEAQHLTLLMRANNETGEFEMAQVKELLRELDKNGADLDLTGFGETFIAGLNEIKDIVPMDFAKAKADFTLNIVCDNAKELEKLQSMLRITSKKAKAQRIIKILESYLSASRAPHPKRSGRGVTSTRT